jgi:hypothetical protein
VPFLWRASLYLRVLGVLVSEAGPEASGMEQSEKTEQYRKDTSEIREEQWQLECFGPSLTSIRRSE